MTEFREREWCRTCRTIQRFDTLPSTGRGAPDFRICVHCGFGYSIDRESG